MDSREVAETPWRGGAPRRSAPAGRGLWLGPVLAAARGGASAKRSAEIAACDAARWATLDPGEPAATWCADAGGGERGGAALV